MYENGKSVAEAEDLSTANVRGKVDEAMRDLERLLPESGSGSGADVKPPAATKDANGHVYVDFYILSYVFYHYMTDKNTTEAIFNLITPRNNSDTASSDSKTATQTETEAEASASASAMADSDDKRETFEAKLSRRAPAPVYAVSGTNNKASSTSREVGAPVPVLPLLPPADGTCPPCALFISERSEDQSIYTPLEAAYSGKVRVVRLMSQKLGRDDRQMAIVPDAGKGVLTSAAKTQPPFEWWDWGLGYLHQDLLSTEEVGSYDGSSPSKGVLTRMEMTYPNVPYEEHKKQAGHNYHNNSYNQHRKPYSHQNNNNNNANNTGGYNQHRQAHSSSANNSSNSSSAGYNRNNNGGYLQNPLRYSSNNNNTSSSNSSSSGRHSDNRDRERSDRERSDRERSDRDHHRTSDRDRDRSDSRSDRDRSDRDRDRERSDRERDRSSDRDRDRSRSDRERSDRDRDYSRGSYSSSSSSSRREDRDSARDW